MVLYRETKHGMWILLNGGYAATDMAGSGFQLDIKGVQLDVSGSSIPIM